MKKELLLSLLFIFSLGAFVASCDDDDDYPKNGAKVEVTVKYDDGDRAPNQIVYMYKDNKPTNDTPISEAIKSMTTNSNGRTDFILDFTELNIFENNTKLYFVVYYYDNENTGVRYMGGGEDITISRNETKKVTIDLLYD